MNRHPGLGGEHATRDLGGNPHNPAGDIGGRPFTTSSGKVLKDPLEASLARHSEGKWKETPWKSFTSTFEKANGFNRTRVAMVEMNEGELLKRIQSRDAGRVPYDKMGDTKNLLEQEFCLKKVPKEDWKMVTEKPPEGPELREQAGGPLAGFKYTRNADGEKVFRLYRGLSPGDPGGNPPA